jgi:hypothetical protein
MPWPTATQFDVRPKCSQSRKAKKKNPPIIATHAPTWKKEKTRRSPSSNSIVSRPDSTVQYYSTASHLVTRRARVAARRGQHPRSRISTSTDGNVTRSSSSTRRRALLYCQCQWCSRRPSNMMKRR